MKEKIISGASFDSIIFEGRLIFTGNISQTIKIKGDIICCELIVKKGITLNVTGWYQHHPIMSYPTGGTICCYGDIKCEGEIVHEAELFCGGTFYGYVVNGKTETLSKKYIGDGFCYRNSHGQLVRISSAIDFYEWGVLQRREGFRIKPSPHERLEAIAAGLTGQINVLEKRMKDKGE